jgi:hypothetical protein
MRSTVLHWSQGPGCRLPVLNPNRVFKLKRLVPAAVAAVVMLLPGTAQAKRTERTIEITPVTFEILSANCSKLPPGTTLNGTGTLTSTTWTTKRRGHRTVTNSSVAPGTATDQAGNQYTFLYSNQFRVTNTRARPKVHSGIMIDVFTLNGTGPAALSNGFVANYKTDLGDLQRIRPDRCVRRSVRLRGGKSPLRSAIAAASASPRRKEKARQTKVATPSSGPVLRLCRSAKNYRQEGPDARSRNGGRTCE